MPSQALSGALWHAQANPAIQRGAPPRTLTNVRADTKTRRFFRGLLGVALVLQGINHFVLDAEMARWIPAWLPAPLLLVHLSGIAEIVLGLGLFVPRMRRLVGWGIVALLVAVFPANIEMARHPELLPQVPEILFWIRLPLQLLFVWWVWACAIAVTPPQPALTRP
jgi:uncharacterized membrane protein